MMRFMNDAQSRHQSKLTDCNMLKRFTAYDLTGRNHTCFPYGGDTAPRTLCCDTSSPTHLPPPPAPSSMCYIYSAVTTVQTQSRYRLVSAPTPVSAGRVPLEEPCTLYYDTLGASPCLRCIGSVLNQTDVSFVAIHLSLVSAEGVPLGEPCTLYYDTKRGSLPQGARPVFKAGLNRWETIQLADMQKADAAPAGSSDWWSVDITIPKVNPRS